MADKPDPATVTAPTVPALVQGEVEVADLDEMYQRQCHPTFIASNGEPSSQLFKDFDEKLSGTRNSVVNAVQSFDNYLAQGLPTVGTWAVTVGEVRFAGSRIIDDVASADAPDPCPQGHAYLDYRLVQTASRKRFRNALLIAARARGKLHPKPPSTQLSAPLGED